MTHAIPDGIDNTQFHILLAEAVIRIVPYTLAWDNWRQNLEVERTVEYINKP